MYIYTFIYIHTYIYTYIHIYTYDWVTLLYSRNWHNIVNQLSSNKATALDTKLIPWPRLLFIFSNYKIVV